MIGLIKDMIRGVFLIPLALAKFFFFAESVRLYKLPAGTKMIFTVRSGKRYAVKLIDPRDPRGCRVEIQEENSKKALERILGGAYGPGEASWRPGYVRVGMGLRMRDPHDKFLSLQYPTDAVVSWEILPKDAWIK